MVIAEGPRFPDLTRSFFEVGKTPAVSAVRNYIAVLGRRGTRKITNPQTASSQFFGLIDESVLWVRVMGDERQLITDETAKVVEQAVAIFLGHYRGLTTKAPRPSSRSKR